MSNIVAYEGERKQLTAADIRAQVNLIQEVVQAVMKPDVHYGVVPGTKKPSLYKAGAEKICVAFRVAEEYRIDDLSTPECMRYRVRCIGTHQVTGIMLGEGVGECSSDEEKYKWRAAVCDEEWEDTAPNQRRVKYAKWQGRVEKKKQVKTEPADVANTVLKMACKRAKIAMTLNVTAASDFFTQDIEDLPEHLRHADDDGEVVQRRQKSIKGIAGDTPPPSLAEVLAAIAVVSDKASKAYAVALAERLASEEDKVRARDALKARQAAVKAQQEKAKPDIDPVTGEILGPPSEEGFTYAQVAATLEAARGNRDQLDEAANTIGLVPNEAHRAELGKLYATYIGELAESAANLTVRILRAGSVGDKAPLMD